MKPEKVADTAENRTLQLLIKEELHLINPVIRSAVRCEVKKCIPSEIYSKGDIKELLEESNSMAVKTYADITSSNLSLMWLLTAYSPNLELRSSSPRLRSFSR